MVPPLHPYRTFLPVRWRSKTWNFDTADSTAGCAFLPCESSLVSSSPWLVKTGRERAHWPSSSCGFTTCSPGPFASVAKTFAISSCEACAGTFPICRGIQFCFMEAWPQIYVLPGPRRPTRNWKKCFGALGCRLSWRRGTTVFTKRLDRRDANSLEDSARDSRSLGPYCSDLGFLSSMRRHLAWILSLRHLSFATFGMTFLQRP